MAKKLTPQQIQNRTAKLKPAIASHRAGAMQELAKELESLGGTLAPNGTKKSAAGDGTFFSVPMPFQPEFADPSKLHYPIDRHQQNRYWRMYYKVDPIVGSVIDMFSEMLCSNMEIVGEGVNGEIKRAYEDMINSTHIVSMFQYFIKEYLIIGEVVPHLIFDDAKGIWTDILFHNPDQINVLSSPFMNMPPVLEFVPDESLRNFAKSKNPQVLEYLSELPSDILSSIMSGGNISLNTKMNVSFIPRKLFPYDVRGTSIMPRLWQILMYEQSVMNASIATARRHAGPVKVVKVGHPEGHWMPTEEDFQDLLGKLTMAEQDPHTWLVNHPFINFEAWGTTDRMITISREADLIERIKLTALGVSQGFLHGDATYAASKVNMNTLMSRLRGMRVFFENIWFYPKFFKPIAEINQWIKPSKAEVSHRFKKKRTASSDAGRFIIPKIVWSQPLEAAVDKDLLDAIRLLNDLGVKSSKSTSFAAAGLDFESEVANGFIEQKIEKKIRNKILPEEVKKKTVEEEITAPGGFSIPMEPESPTGVPSPIEQIPERVPPPEGAEVGEGVGEETAPAAELPTEVAPASRRGLRITANDVDDLIDMLETGKTDSDIWTGLRGKSETVPDFISMCNWERVSDYMELEGFKDVEIEYLRKSLVKKGVIEPETSDKLEEAIDRINMAALMDDGLNNKINSIIDNSVKKKIEELTTTVNAKAANNQEEYDSFLVGEGNSTYAHGDFIMHGGGNITKKDISNYRRKKTMRGKED